MVYKVRRYHPQFREIEEWYNETTFDIREFYPNGKSPEKTGEGAGTVLMNHAAQVALKLGCRHMTIFLPLEAALGFYQKMGFEMAGMSPYAKARMY